MGPVLDKKTGRAGVDFGCKLRLGILDALERRKSGKHIQRIYRESREKNISDTKEDHPDTVLLRRFGIDVHSETLAPFHNPDTYETNVAGLYVAGSVVAGKFNNRIFVENGRLHVPAIVHSILSKGS